jgi:hypothetical protein
MYWREIINRVKKLEKEGERLVLLGEDKLLFDYFFGGGKICEE